jgi:hypothetical protein
MRQSTARSKSSQAKIRRNRFIWPSLVGRSAPIRENTPEGAPCAALTLIASACPCSSARSIRRLMVEGGVCPLRSPEGCPLRRISPL